MLKKPIIWILLLGLLLRLLFLFFGAEIYFDRENVYVDGDTSLWTTMFENLWTTGTFTYCADHEYGYFARTPGYSVFIGSFYLLWGKNWEAAFPWIALVQVLLDTVAVYAMFRIGQCISDRKATAVVLALLYATYPFTIVWTPVVYSESVSISTMIIGLFFILRNRKYDLLYGGALISFATLCRPQVILLLPVVGFSVILKNKEYKSLMIRRMGMYIFAVMLVYGAWPARNYFVSGKLVPTQDLRALETAGEDWLAFTQFVYAVKPEWQPQFRNLTGHHRVFFPEHCYTVKQDSVALEKTVFLAQNNGSSFSNWEGYWKSRFGQMDRNSNLAVAEGFHKLRTKQVARFPLDYYVLIPLHNLKKAMFKIHLVTPGSTFVGTLGSLLFLYRTLLIVLGLIGVVLMIGKKGILRQAGLVSLLFFLLLYVALCFGTGPQFRNIEMRYFIHADTLLLISGAVALLASSDKLFRSKKS